MYAIAFIRIAIFVLAVLYSGHVLVLSQDMENTLWYMCGYAVIAIIFWLATIATSIIMRDTDDTSF